MKTYPSKNWAAAPTSEKCESLGVYLSPAFPFRRQDVRQRRSIGNAQFVLEYVFDVEQVQFITIAAAKSGVANVIPSTPSNRPGRQLP